MASDQLGDLIMPRLKLFPFAFALALAIADFDPVLAVPASSHVVGAAATVSDSVDLARFRGGGRGGYRGGGRVAHRGYGFRGGGMYRGYGARRAAVGRYWGYGARRLAAGRYRVGGRYYGGVWYGARGRYWRGRWWAYGVGSCWRSTPIGYVWICG
jgi:hypothetical protein